MQLLCHGTWGGRPVALNWARVKEVIERLGRMPRAPTGSDGTPVLPGGDPVCYGGETSCLELSWGASGRLFLDAGSGFRSVRPLEPQERVHVFLTHLHVDHVIGLILNPWLWTGDLQPVVHALRQKAGKLDRLLGKLFRPPFWPVSLAMLGDRVRYVEHEPGEVIAGDAIGGPAELELSCLPVAHTDVAVAWRVTCKAKTVVFVADREAGRCDQPAFARFAAGADLLIHDAQYTPEEYKRHVSWGHSAYTDAVDAAVSAGVRRLWLWHHAPDRSYAELDALACAARRYAEERAQSRGAKPVTVEAAYDGLRSRL